jgi:GGDEF domain-containing protein
MDSGTLEMQIFLSLIVVLATAFVALLCDYLKGSNESLRERNIELRVRQEEREFQRAAEEWTKAAQRWPIRTPVIRTPIQQEMPAMEVESAEPGAAEPGAAETGAAAPETPHPAGEIEGQDTAAVEIVGEAPEETPESKPEKVEEPFVLPPGMHDHAVLVKYLSRSEPFSGVVVSIGINDYATQLETAGRETMAETMLTVESMISGLLRAGVDFGCRSGDDEFLLVFPKEQGADAQRRLAAISERLWNFQLRSSGSAPVVFCWGAVEVQGESLADSVASASERMHQTKRNRKTISLQAKPRKLAV